MKQHCAHVAAWYWHVMLSGEWLLRWDRNTDPYLWYAAYKEECT